MRYQAIALGADSLRARLARAIGDADGIAYSASQLSHLSDSARVHGMLFDPGGVEAELRERIAKLGRTLREIAAEAEALGA